MLRKFVDSFHILMYYLNNTFKGYIDVTQETGPQSYMQVVAIRLYLLEILHQRGT